MPTWATFFQGQGHPLMSVGEAVAFTAVWSSSSSRERLREQWKHFKSANMLLIWQVTLG